MAVHPGDQAFNAKLLSHYDAVNTFFAPGKYLGNTPEQVAFSLGTYAFGRLRDQPKVAHLGMDLLQAQILSEILIEPLKFAVHRERPDGSNHQSFPSGHAVGDVCDGDRDRAPPRLEKIGARLRDRLVRRDVAHPRQPALPQRRRSSAPPSASIAGRTVVHHQCRLLGVHTGRRARRRRRADGLADALGSVDVLGRSVSTDVSRFSALRQSSSVSPRVNARAIRRNIRKSTPRPVFPARHGARNTAQRRRCRRRTCGSWLNDDSSAGWCERRSRWRARWRCATARGTDDAAGAERMALRRVVSGLPRAAHPAHPERERRHRRRVLVHAGRALQDRDHPPLAGGRARPRARRSAGEPELSGQRSDPRRSRRRRHPDADAQEHRARHPALEDDAVRRPEQMEFSGANYSPTAFVPQHALRRLRGRDALLHRRPRRSCRAS